MAYKIAILTPAFGLQGGITSWTSFLLKAINAHSSYDATVVSVATSKNDVASRRALNPSSWRKCPTIIKSLYDGISFPHIGAVLAEAEPARYWPHNTLNTIL